MERNINFQMTQLAWQDILVDWDDLNYSLGKGYKLEGDVLSIMLNLESQVSRICRPCYGYCIYPAEGVEEANIRLGGCSLHTGSIITPFLTGAEYFVLFVATAGNEFENFQQKVKSKGEIAEEFLLDSLGSAIAEAIVRRACDDLETKLRLSGYGISYPYSPGYCGWHVSDQQILFSLLPEFPCGITLNTSSLMCPIKSVSGVIAIGVRVNKQKYGCELCGKKDCYKNRKVK